MKSSVLIVDDEERNRDLLKAILAPAGYELQFAENGRDGIKKTIDFRPDLILLDVMMPDMSGFEVCEALRKSPTTVDIPIVMVTGLDDRESRLLGIEAGADDFISKPIDAGEMRTRVKNITQLNRYRRLVAEREKFERIAEFATDGLLLLDDRNRIKYANPRAGELLGLQDESVDQDFISQAGKNYLCKPPFAWKTSAGSAEPDPKPIRYLLARPGVDAAAKWLKTQLFLLPETGEADWLVRLSDVTKEMSERRDSWSFHRALREKLDPTFENVICELDQLANPDLGMTGEKRSQLGMSVRKTVRQLQSQISDLMKYAESSTLLEEGDPVKIRDVKYQVRFVSDALGLFGSHVQVPYELESVELGIKSLAFETVLTELFGNSVKFHPRSSPAVEVVIARPDEGHITLEVRDDGATLNDEELAKASTPYFQGDNTKPGMGLGLGMISSILWELDGDLQIANRETMKGVVVTVTLPIV